jgi:hypothetical protein
LDEQRALLIQMGYVGLANELDEDTTDERKQELLKADREQRLKKQRGDRAGTRGVASPEETPKKPK